MSTANKKNAALSLSVPTHRGCQPETLRKALKFNNMKSVTVCIKVDERQESHLLPLVDRYGEYFVANPHAAPHVDKLHHSVLVRLDPKRLVEAPDASFPSNYTGILLEIQTLPEA